MSITQAKQIAATIQSRLDNIESDPKWLNDMLATLVGVLDRTEEQAPIAPATATASLGYVTPESAAEAIEATRYLADKIKAGADTLVDSRRSRLDLDPRESIALRCFIHGESFGESTASAFRAADNFLEELANQRDAAGSSAAEENDDD